MARYTAPELKCNSLRRWLLMPVFMLGITLGAASVYAQEYESDEAQAIAEDASEYVEEQYPGTVPGMDQIINEDGTIDYLPGEEEEVVTKKYVYKKPTADDEFFGTHLPKRVFNNIPPRF